MKPNLTLDPAQIIATIERLENRISDRFPDSGLRKICSQFLDVAVHTKENIEWISKPNLPLRFISYFVILLGIAGLFFSIKYVEVELTNTSFTNLVVLAEAIFNDLVLLGAAIFFLVTLESRIKRKRALKALNDLRVIAHVIDMHQLTKDPNIITSETSTEHSPKRTLTTFELQRYLDYSSEAAALIAKVSALYSQSLPDEVVVSAANDIETLCTGLSQKIWQKLMILND